VFLNKPESVT